MAQNIRTKGNPTLENGQQRIYLRFLTVFLLVGALAAVAFIMGSLITMYSAFGDFEEFRRMDIGTLFAKLIPGLIMFLIAFAALIAFIVIWFRKTVSDPLVDIDAGMQEIKRGNYSARITIDSRDEFYNIAQTFNATMDRIQALIQTEEERARMQHNIMEFLGILSAASEGDLTKKAVVTPDVFGSLADAFNLMSSGLAELITSVQVSAAEANAKSSALVRITEQLASGAGKQEKEVQTASAFVQDSSQSALIIARKTNSARQIAESATAAAEKGGKMVSSSMSGIQVIRNTVQAINKRMKSLAEKLMEIGTISQ
ncbi:MAG TPA: HAMP domain-containing protein, partial [Dissulfurispiraceae bacterium]|nr:HAMP domain-containing protein [Dissulfurispiraceae bacterium]